MSPRPDTGPKCLFRQLGHCWLIDSVTYLANDRVHPKALLNVFNLFAYSTSL